MSVNGNAVHIRKDTSACRSHLKVGALDDEGWSYIEWSRERVETKRNADNWATAAFSAQAPSKILSHAEQGIGAEVNEARGSLSHSGEGVNKTKGFSVASSGNYVRVFEYNKLVAFVYPNGQVQMKPTHCLNSYEKGALERARRAANGADAKEEADVPEQAEDWSGGAGTRAQPRADMYGNRDTVFMPANNWPRSQFRFNNNWQQPSAAAWQGAWGGAGAPPGIAERAGAGAGAHQWPVASRWAWQSRL